MRGKSAKINKIKIQDRGSVWDLTKLYHGRERNARDLQEIWEKGGGVRGKSGADPRKCRRSASVFFWGGFAPEKEIVPED